ncbi:uncharacterized protein [Maniola hyperantus]|uniref:uncharacterized protein n=1 Tax=Aphantopus hyperantus TaxID=2795564 RepID=UPI003748A646
MSTHKTSKQGKITVQNIQQDKNENPSHHRSGSSAFADSRKESWRFWKDNKFTSKNKSDDTCSCVSCALKKFCSSEYTCVACLLILFSVSVTAAFLMVFKTMPAMEELTEKNTQSENLKKIQMLKEKRQLTEIYGYDFTEKSKWSDSLMNPVGSYSNIEYTGNSYKGSNIMDDLENGMSEDLESILDNEKMMEGQNNQRLKDFFKKLIQTDVQIRKLKETINNNYRIDNLKPITDRFKRSVRKIKGKHRFRPKFSKTTVTMHTNMNTSKETVVTPKKDYKRSVTDDNVSVTGYVIESKEVVIQYNTDKKKNFPKCSHIHEEKSHENKLKHPYYKHSQRDDEQLETDKKPDATTENFDVAYDITGSSKTEPDNDKDDDENVTEPIMKTAKTKSDDKNALEKSLIRANTESYDRGNSKMNDYERRIEEKPQYRRFNYESDGLSHHHHHHLKTTTTTSTTKVKDVTDGETSDTSSDFDYNMEKFLSTAPLYDLALSVSTFIIPMDREVLKQKLPKHQHLGQRNLLQVDEEDEVKEDLIYDDLKEVLADDKEGHDDMERHGERKKRDYGEKIAIPEDFNQNKQSPLNAINLNWKEPMLLYPDELNAMIKQAALQNLYMHAPLSTRDSKVKRDIDEKASALSDTQYIEDYTDKKYDKLAKMAQAYSDYGVLHNKGNMNFNDKGTKSSYMKRFKKLFNTQKPLGRYLKGSTRDTEGFRFEINHGSASNNKGFGEGFQKHFEFLKNSYGDHSITPIDISNMTYEYDKLFTPTYLLNTTIDLLKTTDLDRSFIFTIKKGNGLRTLKSIDMTYEDNKDNKDINEAIESNINEVNDTINEVMNLTDFDIMAYEINDVMNEETTLNSYEIDDKINATKFQNRSEDADIINETLAVNTTTENNNIREPSETNINEANNKINGTYAFNATNDKIPNENSNDFNIRKSLRALKSIDFVDDVIVNRIFDKSAINLAKTNVSNNNKNSTKEDRK